MKVTKPTFQPVTLMFENKDEYDKFVSMLRWVYGTSEFMGEVEETSEEILDLLNEPTNLP